VLDDAAEYLRGAHSCCLGNNQCYNSRCVTLLSSSSAAQHLEKQLLYAAATCRLGLVSPAMQHSVDRRQAAGQAGTDLQCRETARGPSADGVLPCMCVTCWTQCGLHGTPVQLPVLIVACCAEHRMHCRLRACQCISRKCCFSHTVTVVSFGNLPRAEVLKQMLLLLCVQIPTTR
jgi:hypothetical protein